ncbi:alpha/beta fold hydrolase [Pseudomonas sp. SLFW]|uniref:alpha/beta hydrolase n=1 Tax=Pseudomonas sp. SLFW TaxID=2683259 RepID=UPI0014133995|nr:alpha/beta hydrolase [Pseudomonas sp. SLFW]NBB10770.1 alpha/beta fold hydrolase [Pseudomonas sp. SLFW]
MTDTEYLDEMPLPEGIRSRQIEGVNGLSMHVLEAGYSNPERPCILLLHGFPELAYSWRNTLLGLSRQGYHVIAPDQRGYGRTTGWEAEYETDLRPFFMLNLVSDAIALLAAMGRDSVAAVVGHDFGSPVAAYCALVRPDIFRAVVLMSAPFSGPPLLASAVDGPDMSELLAALSPPKKHYQHYYCTRSANRDMTEPEGGLARFLRTYFHVKSGDWSGNSPFPLLAWSADELVKMPPYYIMGLDDSMPAAIDADAPDATEAKRCEWLTGSDLAFFTGEFQRTGFQGGLNWYRCSFLADHDHELSVFAGRTINVPSCFIYGEKDWGAFQAPGALETMQNTACTDMRFIESIPGAGHWVQQEQPERVVSAMMRFLQSAEGLSR